MGPVKERSSRASNFPLPSLTGNAANFVDLLPIAPIRTLRIVERLCGKKQMVAKKDYKAHHQRARRSRRKPRGECVHTRFADGVHRQTSFRIYSLPSAALISRGIRKCIRSVAWVRLVAVKALKILLNQQGGAAGAVEGK